MKIISERISIVKKEDVLSIVILPTTDKKKLGLMFLWLFAWTVCGIVVFASYFKLSDQDSKTFVLIYLAFWSYFEYAIVRSYIWKRFGREKIWLREGKVHYQREINKKGKIKEFQSDLVSPFRLLSLSRTSFTDSFYQSFWVKGGERIVFNCQSREIRLGMQLSDDEAATLINELNAFLKKSLSK